MKQVQIEENPCVVANHISLNKTNLQLQPFAVKQITMRLNSGNSPHSLVEASEWKADFWPRT